MDEIELDKIIEELDANEEITQFAFADINPAVFDGLPSTVRKIQKLHLIFKQYFASSEKYNMVIDKVAYNLSHGNPDIRRMVDIIYNEPFITYDETIRKIQASFKDFFGTNSFVDMVSNEIGNAMTELVNKMFVII